MSRRKHTAPEQQNDKREPGIVFSFQVSLRGILGIGVVLVCLFLWMFLIGIWAGQTILYPPPPPPPAASDIVLSPPPEKNNETTLKIAEPLPKLEQPAETGGILIVPTQRKRRIAPHKSSAAAETQ